jgi:hypothetical protein
LYPWRDDAIGAEADNEDEALFNVGWGLSLVGRLLSVFEFELVGALDCCCWIVVE